jgi:hypothetical protein
MTRAERMHKSQTARTRRNVTKTIRVLRTLGEWARAHRERVKYKKRVRSQTSI